MSDLIERSEVLKQLRLNHKDVVYIDKKECARRIEAIPCARPKGKWIEHKERTIVMDNNFVDFFPTEYECSNCGLRRATYFINSPLSNYCPNCGADMRERKESE